MLRGVAENHSLNSLLGFQQKVQALLGVDVSSRNLWPGQSNRRRRAFDSFHPRMRSTLASISVSSRHHLLRCICIILYHKILQNSVQSPGKVIDGPASLTLSTSIQLHTVSYYISACIYTYDIYIYTLHFQRPPKWGPFTKGPHTEVLSPKALINVQECSYMIYDDSMHII